MSAITDFIANFDTAIAAIDTKIQGLKSQITDLTAQVTALTEAQVTDADKAALQGEVDKINTIVNG